MNRQSGITLVEVAISVAIIGILLGGALELQQRARAQRQFESTYDNMDAIIQALSIYAETAGRLPCPADPAVYDASFGWERGVRPADLQAGHSPTGSCDAKTRDGIVPFMTIGLPVQTARDGWGNFYSYAVSPVFTRPNDQTSAAADTGRVHGRCRAHASGRDAPHRMSCRRSRRRCTACRRRPSRSRCTISPRKHDSEQKAKMLV